RVEPGDHAVVQGPGGVHDRQVGLVVVLPHQRRDRGAVGEVAGTGLYFFLFVVNIDVILVIVSLSSVVYDDCGAARGADATSRMP
ncbi:hypothetical protein, partial [Streptomyces sp. BE303]|uniref:hypothetical protein n=1 Tax=Streptomyces sp. BE303 TaxID=3002528 RepID=UPI002E77EA8A